VNNLTLLSGALNGTGNAIENVITGNAAANSLSGGDGNDTLTGAGGSDTLSGGTGNDHFIFNVTPGSANAAVVTDFASGADVLRLDGKVMPAIGASGGFTSGDARFYAAAGANAGHDADDRVVYNTTTGQLWYDADGSGSGTAQLIATLQGAPALAATDIRVDNGTSTTPPPAGSITGTEGNDTLSGTTANDTIFGLGGNDLVYGDSGADSIVGGAGNDSLNGNGGNDWLEGGLGNDSLNGGGDPDSYVFREFGAPNADVITDFGSNWDMLRFDGGAFTAAGGAGHFAAGDARFYAAAGATGGHDADDRFVYNTSTGQLYYDADGSGAGAAQLVATIQGAPAVAATDIWVI
jgi:Ca2+-binding RTX toxin-like protein